MKITAYNTYPTNNLKPLHHTTPNFGNDEDDNNDKRVLLAIAGGATLAAIFGVRYLCKSSSSSIKKQVDNIKNTSTEINNKYSDVLEWVNNDLEFHKRKPLTDIKVSNSAETEKFLDISDNTLIVNEQVLNNIDTFLTNKIKKAKENNILNINFNCSGGKEAEPIPGTVRVLAHEIKEFEAKNLKTTLEKTKLALRLIQVEEATKIISSEPLKFLEQMINGPLKNSSKTKGLLADIEKIKQLSTQKQFELLQAYTEKSNCAWAQDHPIKSLLKDADINLKLYFHPNKSTNTTPKQKNNISTPKNLPEQILWDKNNVIINKSLKELDTPDCKHIYIADPYIFRMGNNMIKTFLKQILDGIKDKEIRIITINLSKKTKKALRNNKTDYNNKIIIKNLIPETKQKPFHDRWIASNEGEFAITNSFNNTSFDISVLKSKDRYYNESERLWNVNKNNINCIIEEIII